MCRLSSNDKYDSRSPLRFLNVRASRRVLQIPLAYRTFILHVIVGLAVFSTYSRYFEIILLPFVWVYLFFLGGVGLFIYDALLGKVIYALCPVLVESFIYIVPCVGTVIYILCHVLVMAFMFCAVFW